MLMPMEWSVLNCQLEDEDDEDEDDVIPSTWLFHLRKCGDGGYQLRLTNAASAFQERLSSDQVQDRCGRINPAVEADSDDLVEEIQQLMSDGTTHLKLRKEGENALELEVAGKLFGYDFRWNFATKKEEDAFDSVLRPALKCISLLLEQRRKLVDIIRAKDLELLDFEQAGHSLTRKNLKTPKFDMKKDGLSRLSAAKPDPELVRMLASDEYREVQRAAEEMGAATDKGADQSPEEGKARAKARARRIKIKGVAGMLMAADKNEDEDDEGGSIVQTQTKRPISSTKKSNNALVKKLKKL